MPSKACFLAAFLSIPILGSSQTPSPQLIRDVRIFDGDRVQEHRSVLIADGKIARIGDAKMKVPPDTEVIEGKERTLLPGLIDAHVHLPDNTEGAMRQALTLGVTTQLDMFTAGERLKKIKSLEAEDRPALSDVRTAGTGVTVAGGHPTQMGGPPVPTISGPADAQAFVDERIAEGSDYIKIIHDDGSAFGGSQRIPMVDNATMRAVVEAAHKRGKLAVVHVLTEQQAREAIEAGADGLAHLFVGATAGSDFGKFAAAHHVFIIPTLTTLYLICGKSEGPAIMADPKLGPNVDQQWRGMMDMKPNPALNHNCNGTDDAIRQLSREHVRILAGTDAPVPGSTYGASIHAEMALLVRIGLTPIQALTAATSETAQTFHLKDRGHIQAGLRADLLLVEGDPTTDILATRNIVAVWKNGIRAQR